MSISLSVFATHIPENLKTCWESSLAEYGLRCEIYPRFDPENWPGGFLPIKLEIEPKSFPAADRYGNSPLVAGFELYILNAEPQVLESWLEAVSEDIAKRMRAAEKHFFFITSAGRSAADLRIQYFAAATLAILANAVLLDGQADQAFIGHDAIQAASREADHFDFHPQAFRDWRSLAFEGWES